MAAVAQARPHRACAPRGRGPALLHAVLARPRLRRALATWYYAPRLNGAGVRRRDWASATRGASSAPPRGGRALCLGAARDYCGARWGVAGPRCATTLGTSAGRGGARWRGPERGVGAAWPGPGDLRLCPCLALRPCRAPTSGRAPRPGGRGGRARRAPRGVRRGEDPRGLRSRLRRAPRSLYASRGGYDTAIGPRGAGSCVSFEFSIASPSWRAHPGACRASGTATDAVAHLYLAFLWPRLLVRTRPPSRGLGHAPLTTGRAPTPSLFKRARAVRAVPGLARPHPTRAEQGQPVCGFETPGDAILAAGSRVVSARE